MSYGRRRPPEIDGMSSLKVDNLTYRTTAEDLKRLFQKYGEIGDVYIPRHPYTRDSRGFAFVRFYDRRDAEDAMDAIGGYVLDGRELRVHMAKYGRPSDPWRCSGSRGSRMRGRGRSRSRSRRSRSRSKRSRSRSRSRYCSRRYSSRSRSTSRSRRQKYSSSKSRSKSRSHSNGKFSQKSENGHRRNQSKSASLSRSRSRSPVPDKNEENKEDNNRSEGSRSQSKSPERERLKFRSHSRS